MAEGRAESKELVAKQGSSSIIWNWFGYNKSDVEQTSVIYRRLKSVLEALLFPPISGAGNFIYSDTHIRAYITTQAHLRCNHLRIMVTCNFKPFDKWHSFKVSWSEISTHFQFSVASQPSAQSKVSNTYMALNEAEERSCLVSFHCLQQLLFGCHICSSHS
ncbi:hypothetical protein E2C01_006703 [Portunus trituberculatus]|uniref:Uncharacterized protein n=1 Tax=Portunus trituberculatus TaxID=210409 RepID=A0A5B7CW28_PORTR|nr:hypothetical protein [Portunus trituberculatus]